MNNAFFMEKALTEANKWLNKGLFPVGCVLVYNNEVISTSSLKGLDYDSLTDLHHAEIIALHRLYNLQQKIDPSKITLFSTLEPCLMCYSTIIISGIKKVVYAYEDVMGGGTNLDLSKLKPLYSNNHISIVPGVLRDKSLNLFKSFFSDPEEDYLRGTLFATYTLEQ